MRRARSLVLAAAALLALGAAAPAGSPAGSLAESPVGLGGPDAPVADAAMRGDLEAVRSLLSAGEDVNAARGDGMTALHWAAMKGRPDVAGVLIEAGAAISRRARGWAGTRRSTWRAARRRPRSSRRCWRREPTPTPRHRPA